MSEPTVTILESEYNQLTQAIHILESLEAAGVDNWEGYEDALADLDFS
jgi:hypothetical protein